MTWGIHAFFLLALIVVIPAKEEKKTALIITLDELKPEESDVIISDVTVKEPHYAHSGRKERSYVPRVSDSAPLEKQLDLIFVHPDDIKALNNFGDVTVEKPNYVKYPDSEEIYESDEYSERPQRNQGYSYSSGYPRSQREEARSELNKYPSKRAPSLTIYSGGRVSKDEQEYTSPKIHQSNPSYDFAPPLRSNPPPSDSTSKSIYTNSEAKRYSAVHSRPPNYESLKPYDSQKHSHPSNIPSYSSVTHSTNPKTRQYSGYSNFGNPDISDSKSPSTYGSADKGTYGIPEDSSSESPSYDSTKFNSHDGVSSYAYPKYSNYGSTEPTSYSASHPYGRSKSSPSLYKNSKPSSQSYSSNPKSVNSHSFTPPHFQSSPNFNDDSSEEQYNSDSDKYYPHPESYDHSHTSYPHDDYHPPSSYVDSEYPLTGKPYRSGYDSPVSVEPAKHVYEDDYSTPHDTAYQPPNNYDTPSYLSSKPYQPFYDPHYRNNRSKQNYSRAIPKTNEKHRSFHSSKSSSHSSQPKIHDKKHVTHGSVSTFPVTSHQERHPKASDPSYRKTTLKEEPITTHNPYPPSYRVASEVSYVPPSYNHNQRSPLSNVKGEFVSSQHESDRYREQYENGYYSSHDSPAPKYAESEYDSSQMGIPPTNFEKQSFYQAHLNRGFGARHPDSYPKLRNTDSKINRPMESDYTSKDVQSSSHREPYQVNGPENGVIKKTHSYYHHHHDDSSEINDNHSAKKNYSPVRPAPLHDQLEQPRYPPLPPPSSTDKTYYDYEENISSEKEDYYTPQTSKGITNSFNPTSDNIKPYSSSLTTSVAESRIPTPEKGKTHHYSDHSSEESDSDTRFYKTTSKNSTPYRSKSDYPSNKHTYLSGGSFRQPISSYSGGNSYGFKTSDFESSQPQYPRPPFYKDVSQYPKLYTYTKKYSAEAKSQESAKNATLPFTYSSVSEILPPKRVEGVVYRSRKSYPYVKAVRAFKGFLPYKTNYKKRNIGEDYKHYESSPSEVQEKNLTQTRYVAPKLADIKPRKYFNFTSYEESEEMEDSNEDSNLDAIPGDPGKDYPVLKEIPRNHFSCENKLPGFYADVENRCQVYYQCGEQGRMQSFLCPNGTLFNQQTFVCEWWHNVNCANSEKYFSKNNQLYKPRSAKERTGIRRYVQTIKPEMQNDLEHKTNRRQQTKQWR